MKKKEEIKYLDKEWKEMNTRLKAFLDARHQEDLHKFRVQIKKLRAMLSLFETASRRHGLLKEFKPVKKIFKAAGEIREAYINLQLAEHYKLKNEHFEASQQEIIQRGVNEFCQMGKKHIKTIKDTYSRLKKDLTRIDDSSISEYYKKQLEQIAGNLETPSFTEDMHDNRKLIKILVYNHKLADKALDGSFQFNAQYLNKLQENIGQWHDNLIAAQLFSTPELHDKPVVNQIKRKNAGVRRTITSMARGFMQKATTVKRPVSVK
jgi:CHAD domain-containing protein